MKQLFYAFIAISLLCMGVANAATSLSLGEKIKRTDKTAILVIWDIVSLNHPSQSPLFAKNLEEYNKSFTRRSLSKLKVKQIEYFLMAKTISSVAIVSNRKSKKVFRDSAVAVNKIKDDIKFIDTTKVGKDILSTVEYINLIVDEKYQEYDHVITVFYSNFRNTVNNKRLKKLKKIPLNPKIAHMYIFAKSGLNYTKNISASQVIHSSSNVKSYFMSRLPQDKVSWYSNY